MRFTGIEQPEEFRTVTRAHVIAWRDELAGRGLSATTIRHCLSALASLFDYLCDQNAVTHNAVKGMKRPIPETTEGKTPRWETPRRGGGCSPPPLATRLRRNVIARSWQRCCITPCAGTSSVEQPPF